MEAATLKISLINLINIKILNKGKNTFLLPNNLTETVPLKSVKKVNAFHLPQTRFIYDFHS